MTGERSSSLLKLKEKNGEVSSDDTVAQHQTLLHHALILAMENEIDYRKRQAYV